jgi:hypothetical protein
MSITEWNQRLSCKAKLARQRKTNICSFSYAESSLYKRIHWEEKDGAKWCKRVNIV